MTQETKPVILPVSLERSIHEMINIQRRAYALPGLGVDPALSEGARYHSSDMALRGYFSHGTPEGRMPIDRAMIAGYPVRKAVGNRIYEGIGENIAKIPLHESCREVTSFVEYPGGIRRVTGRRREYSWYTQQELAAEVVGGWMNSPGHRENILRRHYKREGIGVTFAEDFAHITQNFF